MTKLTGETLNIEEDNIKKIKELFPEVDTEGKIDFDKLKQLLGDYVEDSEERYNFTWNGKGEALRISQTPSMGTLRPAPEESKDWDDTENLYIEGDNLEVLKLLQKSYFEKIDVIYIDPPYNTGGDFVYKDDFKDNIKNYKKITGQVDSEGKPTTTNREHSGRYHTDWLNMMYPRLRLAKNLLKEDGLIFVSIDDNELANLKIMMDQIYGENNFLANITVETSRGVFGAKAAHVDKSIVKAKDYVLVYAMGRNNLNLKPLYMKSKKSFDTHFTLYKNEEYECHLNDFLKSKNLLNKKAELLGIENNIANLSRLMDVFPEVNKFILSEGKNIYRIRDYTLTIPEKYKELLNSREMVEINNLYVFKNNDDKIMYLYPWANLLNITDDYYPEYCSSVVIGDLWSGYNEDMGNIGKEGGVKFPNGKKPTRLIKNILKLINKPNAIVLDFFSGSATAAHAAMDLNAEDNGNRKFIMVQLPEETDKKSEAYKSGYKNIAEIGKERIRRAGDQIKEELTDKYESASEEDRKDMKNPDKLDIGFKTFKLDSSNIKEWNPGEYENIQQAIEDSLTPYVSGRTEKDVVYEMILKMGLDLTYPIEEYEINGQTIYSVGYGFLMICLAEEVDIEVAEKMIEIKENYQPEEFRVIFRDEGFKNDTDKTNTKETLRSAGLPEAAFITL